MQLEDSQRQPIVITGSSEGSPRARCRVWVIRVVPLMTAWEHHYLIPIIYLQVACIYKRICPNFQPPDCISNRSSLMLTALPIIISSLCDDTLTYLQTPVICGACKYLFIDVTEETHVGGTGLSMWSRSPLYWTAISQYQSTVFLLVPEGKTKG